MSGLLIKDLPKDLHEKLRRRAKANQRSLGREALVILKNALADRSGPPTLEQLDAMRVQGKKPLTDAFLARAKTSGRP